MLMHRASELESLASSISREDAVEWGTEDSSAVLVSLQVPEQNGSQGLLAEEEEGKSSKDLLGEALVRGWSPTENIRWSQISI